MPQNQPGGPVPSASRQGRERQRYHNGGRLVAGTIPLRWPASVEVSPDNVEVLLVSSRSGKGLVFPKGGWETDETLAAAAARETLEEAGVRGDLEDSPLGPFACGPSHKAPPGAAADGAASTSTSTSTSTSSTTAHMFAMHVVEELAVWPEGGQRARVWLPLRVALAAARHEWMRAALAAWVGRRGWGGLVPDEDGAAAAVAAALAAVPGGRVGKDKDTAAVR